MATTRLSRLFANDLQASTPEVRIGLSRAGVTGVHKAIRLRRGPHEKLVSAHIDCFVDLEPAQKGVHMSRFPELFGEAIDDVVIGEAFLVEELAEHIAGTSSAASTRCRAEVRIDRPVPARARRRRSRGCATQEMVSLIGIAAASARGRGGSSASRRPGSTPARARRAWCAAGPPSACSRPASTSTDVERILELVPLATHNQRGRGTLYVGTRAARSTPSGWSRSSRAR